MAFIITDSKYYLDIADAIREKNGETLKYKATEMPDAIRRIQNESLIVETESKEITPTKSEQIVVASEGKTLSQVTVHSIPGNYIIPEGKIYVTSNASDIDVAQYAAIDVNVSVTPGPLNGYLVCSDVDILDNNIQAKIPNTVLLYDNNNSYEGIKVSVDDIADMLSAIGYRYIDEGNGDLVINLNDISEEASANITIDFTGSSRDTYVYAKVTGVPDSLYDIQSGGRVVLYDFTNVEATSPSGETYSSGYTDGYNDGINEGRNEADEAKYTEGYQEGHTDGYSTGYDEGYAAGYADANS